MSSEALQVGKGTIENRSNSDFLMNQKIKANGIPKTHVFMSPPLFQGATHHHLETNTLSNKILPKIVNLKAIKRSQEQRIRLFVSSPLFQEATHHHTEACLKDILIPFGC